RQRAPGTGTAARAVDARAVPVRAAGRGARGVPPGPRDPRRGTGHRAGRGVAPNGARDPDRRSGTRPPGTAAGHPVARTVRLLASASCGVLVTSRSRLTGLPGVHRVELGLFDRTAGLELLSRIVGTDRVAAEPDAADDVVDLCGGLPLAVRVVGARLASRPHW